MKGLFITPILDSQFGGGKISNRNFEFFKEVADVVETIEIMKKSSQKHKVQVALNSLLLYSGGLEKKIEKTIIKKIKENSYDYIFFDGSFYGKLYKSIKNISKEIKIITFFHNVEKDFSYQRVRAEGIKYYPIYFSSWYNEKKASKYSDYIITLNQRDSCQLFKYYKRNSDIMIPISIKDNFSQVNNFFENEKIILFVGSLFFANKQGIEWFIKSVMPLLNKDIKLKVVGNGFEKIKSELEVYENVEIIGKADNLDSYYKEASAVIMPIFSGAGMKVKTAEALMYGKTIFGTKEAFEGYDVEFDKIGKLCNDKYEFSKYINLYFENKYSNFNNFSRYFYEKFYSDESAKKIFLDFIKNI